ncbi:MAG: aldehyde dehydrogenase family protein, partial [Planctomycetota bacterium]
MFTDVLSRLGIATTNEGAYASEWLDCPGPEIVSFNPATGQPIAGVLSASTAEYETVVQAATDAFKRWRVLPAPQRGEIVRQIGEALREHKSDLGMLVTLETGKIRSEGLGEVQEMIDMCDYAVGLSRQLFGLTMPSERPQHRMFEQWHPLGPVGIITAFNFPVAVWAWNACLAAVCGDTCIWKPSSQTPLTAVAVQNIVNKVLGKHQQRGVSTLCIGSGATVGQALAEDRRVPLISATGSCAMGRRLAQTVAGRLGRSLLELGGNNGIIVTPTANLELALRAVTFAAVGTAGQRCTSLRRLFLHESIADEFLERLVGIYKRIQIGNPWDPDVLLGPLVSEKAVTDMLAAVTAASEQGGHVLYGGRRLDRPGNFVEPTIIRARSEMPIVREETFAPILYVMTYHDLDDAMYQHNSVDQGLSSAIFTDRLTDAEQFLSPAGSDCGIANVNIGTSGAEIGGAFGGEKETGG